MQFSRNTIPNANEVRGILRSVAPGWRFIAVMPEITAQVGSNYSFTANKGVSYSSTPTLSTPQIPNAICASVDIPPVSMDSDQRFGQGTKIYVPRFVSTGMLTLNFYEDEQYNVSKYLWAWRSLIVDDYQCYGLPKDYKKDISVWAFDSLNNYAAVFMVDFIECWPTNPIGGLSYSQSQSGFLTVSCEFTIDNQGFQFTNGLPPPPALKTNNYGADEGRVIPKTDTTTQG